MQTWIITGGIACGKTSVCESLVTHGQRRISFFSSDKQAQELLDHPHIMQQLAVAFGPEVRSGEGGRTNRSWLRQRVFNDPEARRKLEMLLHPGVLEALEKAKSQARQEPGINLFLAEVPLHYEIGATVSADLVIVVAASQAIQVRRLKERRGLDESIIAQMLRSQWPVDAKVEKADVVIWNDGAPSALESQVLTLARQNRQE
jgi:dephospho-CoA kinase